MAPAIAREVSKVNLTDALPAPDFLATERLMGLEIWAKIGKDEFAEVGLGPCALIVIRAQGDHPPIVGHFYQADLQQKTLHQMLSAAQEEFSSSRGVRVDLFGVSPDLERTVDRSEQNSKATRAFIEASLKEYGFSRVVTHWTKPGNAQHVLINGADRSVYCRELDTEAAVCYA